MAPASHTSGLTDTDILIDATHSVADAIAFLTTQQALSGLQISIISAMELVIGCRNRTELGRAQQFLQRITLLPISRTASQTAYQLMESFYLSHGLLMPDAFIAATALEYGLTLYTKNVRHFQMIPPLTAVRPY
ncbi:MAG: type II toxin-antitoxin system VapC family toxin [Candidatus Poribacteria bacterium]|nr:type II toxin-antitoxin system VapC family toxin [Candidatus Poribacteria bacterium]